jgi:pentatricopeptide repeat protein
MHRVLKIMEENHIQKTRVTYCILLRACARKGDAAKAEEIYQEFLEQNEQEARHQAVYVNRILVCCSGVTKGTMDREEGKKKVKELLLEMFSREFTEHSKNVALGAAEKAFGEQL